MRIHVYMHINVCVYTSTHMSIKSAWMEFIMTARCNALLSNMSDEPIAPSSNYIGHKYIGHNYIGHNYIGHNYV